MQKTFILLVAACLLIWSCSSSKNQRSISTKKIKSLSGKSFKLEKSQAQKHSAKIVMPEFFKRLKLPPKDSPSSIAIVDNKVEQHFSINCKKDTLIVCTEGTKIFIPNNAFVDENNKTVKSVEFSVKEYYSKGDIILAGLTTKADKKMLESGGMVYLTATNGESTCKLDATKNVELSFPTKKSKSGMQVFNGEKKGNIIDWVLPKNSVMQIIPIPVITDDEYEVPTTYDDDLITEGTRGEVVEEEIPIIDQVYAQYEVQESPQFDNGKTMMNAFVLNKFVYPKSCSEAEIQGKVYIEFIVDENGDTKDIKIKRGVHPALDAEAMRVIASFPKWKPAILNAKNVKCRYIFPMNFRIDAGAATVGTPSNFNNNPTNYSATKQEYVKNVVENTTEIDEVEIADLEYYVLNSAKLGWINCDRFIPAQKTERLAINETDQTNTTVRLVFKNINSVLGASYLNGEFVFKDFPANEPVVVVGFKKVGNKNFVAIEETSSNSKTLTLSYKQVSLDELKATIEKINSKGGGLAKN